MTIDEMIAARTLWHQTSAAGGIILGVFLLVVGLVLFFVTRSCRDDGAGRFVALVLGCAMLAISPLLMLAGGYDYWTAGVQAKAEIANYRLLEIKR